MFQFKLSSFGSNLGKDEGPLAIKTSPLAISPPSLSARPPKPLGSTWLTLTAVSKSHATTWACHYFQLTRKFLLAVLENGNKPIGTRSGQWLPCDGRDGEKGHQENIG